MGVHHRGEAERQQSEDRLAESTLSWIHGKHLVFWLAAVIWGFSTLEVGGGFASIFPQTLLASVSSRSNKLPGSRVSECSANAGSILSNLREN